MILTLLLMLWILILGWIFMRWSLVKKYWSARGVPHLPPHPVLGSLTFFQRENMALWTIRLYERFKNPYVGIWVMWKPALIINSPTLARKILNQDSSNFRDRHISSGVTDPIGALNLFTVNDPVWTYMRRRLTNIFTAARLKNQQNYTQTKSKELVKRIQNEGDNKVDLKELFVDYSIDVFGTFAFGVESNATLSELPQGLIVAQAAVLLVAGYDTTATVLTYAIYEIAYNSDIQEKIYQELKEAKQRYGTENFDAEATGEMTYINCVIQETLRKHSPMGWIDRIALADYEIDDNLTIKTGTPVYVNAIGMHYDPDYFPDPYKFNRFLPENKSNIKPYTFLPFGEGPRNCIGQRFGIMTLRNAIAALLLNYKVQPLPNKPKPNEVKVDKISLFYTPGEPLHVDFVPRNNV